jgi:phosphoenolpyruvate carboxykinase (ATP)
MSETGMDARGLVDSLPDPSADSVLHDPTDERLRALAIDDETTTEFGSPAFVSEYRSRCADRTKNSVDDEFRPGDWAHCEAAVQAAGDREMLCLDRIVGRHPEVRQVCRLYVPREHARIALAWGRMLEPAPGGADPDFTTVQIPDREEVAIRVLPDAGFTAVVGSDYTGEAKKSFLRLYMYRVKQAGGLGVHAGSKRLHLEEGEVGQLFLGLSGTGKTTLTGHGLWLDDPECAEMLQDDVCAMLPDGTVAGSEGAGLYIKTIGLDSEEQPALYQATTAESAVLENVATAEDGTVDFDDDALTANGRAVVQRDDLPSASEDVDLPAVDQVFFITRNPLMPPVARLSPEQAAAAFMLGESVETSAGNPDAAGDSVRVVGTNPFIVGPEGGEGNRFLELVTANDVDCFLLNTGTVGDRDVSVEDTVGILEGLARGDVAWREDDALGLAFPERLGDVDVDALYPPERVDDFQQRHEWLCRERKEYLRLFEELDDHIVDAVY